MKALRQAPVNAFGAEEGDEVVEVRPGGRPGELSAVAGPSARPLDLALLIPELVNGQRHLEGWEVRESQYLKGIEAKGEGRARRADLLRVLQARLGNSRLGANPTGHRRDH